jgi:pyridoxal phosphate enzyme (YggS family)
MSEHIQNNIRSFQQKIFEIAMRCKRDPNDIELIAVSKYHNTESVKKAYQAGCVNFGENYLQEWKEKSTQLEEEPLSNIKWHIIGNLQKNKVKFLNSKVYCLQSLDSLELAKEIEKKCLFNLPLRVLVQLQIDFQDTNKFGATIEHAKNICEFVGSSKKMVLQGFMGIGPAECNEEKRKDLYFSFTEKSKILWQEYNTQRLQKPIISLGMSSDYAIAIECGSTMLRIGTAIFGTRKNNKVT